MSSVKNGLYSIKIEMKDGARGRASGVIVLLDGQILGGDTHFYYSGSYASQNGKRFRLRYGAEQRFLGVDWHAERAPYQGRSRFGVANPMAQCKLRTIG